MQHILEKIRTLSPNLPERFSREKAGQGGVVAGILGLLPDMINPVKQVRELLQSPEMGELVESNQVTVAMIKPRLDQYLDKVKARAYFNGDAELTQFMIGQIKQAGLDPILAVSLQMTEKMVAEFYAGKPMENMQKFRDPDSGDTVWNEFNKLMASGPVTFLLLYSPVGHARESWRTTMGTSYDVDVVKREQPHTFRALAKKNLNNLFHGSDSTEAVKKEIAFIVKNIR